jgi:preprotein translocase subunit SecG
LLTYLLYGLFILSCLVLVVAVLLQPGKADAGALFTSSVSSTAFGPRGTQTILAKVTIVAAALFMLVALTLSLPIVTGSRSVVGDESEATPAQTTAPAPAPDTTVPATGTTQSSTEATSAPAANTNAATPQEGNANSNTDGQPQASPQQQQNR